MPKKTKTLWCNVVSKEKGLFSDRPLFSRSHRLVCLFTHYHWDHIQGIPLSPALYNHGICWTFYGYNPSSHEGPRQAVRTLLRPPYFPVGFHQLGRRLNFVPITSYPQEFVIVFHPHGEDVLMPLDEFEKIDAAKKTVGFGPRGSYPVDECLVVKMCKSNHPEFTISYRFEERPTGRVFVFLTDHEVTAAFSNDFLRHVRGAHLLIADAQYSQERYPKGAAGFGHGTGPYCVQLAKEAGVRILGLTHRDPNSSDHDVESILSEALEEATSVFPPQGDTESPKMCPIVVFSCSDYQQIPV